MPLSTLAPTDTRPLFRPVSTELVTLLRALPPEDWAKPTIAGSWVVRDIVAHLVDLSFRRLSFHRDRMAPPPPPKSIGSERDFVEFINWLNATWIDATARFSPRVLTDLFDKASRDLADWFESLPLEAPALFGVSWAGERESEGWFDIGREFTELWHHQQQIRLAVGAPPLDDPRYLRATLEISLRGLPHAFRDTSAADGDTVLLDVRGPSGGQWTLLRGNGRWTLEGGEPAAPTTVVRLSDEDAWKVLFNALGPAEAAAAIAVEGRRALADTLLRARSVIV